MSKPTIRTMRRADFPIKDRQELVIVMSKRVKGAMQPHALKSDYLFETNRASTGRARYRFDNKKALVAALKRGGARDRRPVSAAAHLVCW